MARRMISAKSGREQHFDDIVARLGSLGWLRAVVDADDDLNHPRLELRCWWMWRMACSATEVGAVEAPNDLEEPSMETITTVGA